MREVEATVAKRWLLSFLEGKGITQIKGARKLWGVPDSRLVYEAGISSTVESRARAHHLLDAYIAEHAPDVYARGVAAQKKHAAACAERKAATAEKKAQAKAARKALKGKPSVIPSPFRPITRTPDMHLYYMSKDFLTSYEWRAVRMQVLKRDGAVCACCGATRDHGAIICVDHIKPRKLFPELALSLDNLQVLCEECNHGKGNWDMTDWRKQQVPQKA